MLAAALSMRPSGVPDGRGMVSGELAAGKTPRVGVWPFGQGDPI